MKKYLTHLWKQKIIALIVLITSFLLGLTISSIINTYNSNYFLEFTCESDNEINFDNLLTKEYLEEIKVKCNEKNNYYDDINVNKIIDEKAIRIEAKSNNTYVLITESEYYPDFFLKSTNSVSTRAKTYLKTALTTYATDNSYNITFINKNIIEKHSPISTGWVYGISTLSMVGMFIIYLGADIYSYKKHKEMEEIPYDNETIYKTPFHKSYWKGVFSIFKDVKKMTMIAMMLGLMILCKLISLPSGFGNLGISPTYIVFAITSMIFGPFAGFILGILSDIIGYVLFQTSYAFFIGYTLQAALTGMIYGLVLYKTKISFTRCFLARVLVNFIMNVLLGSICQGIVANYTIQQTCYYAIVFSFPKNLVYLVPQSIALFIIMRSLAPALVRFGLIDRKQIIRINRVEE